MALRPPALGWLLIVYGVASTVLGVYGMVETLRARAVTSRAVAALDSLAVLQCIPVKPGSQVRVFPPPRADVR